MVGRTPLTGLVAAILCSDEFRKSPLHDTVASALQGEAPSAEGKFVTESDISAAYRLLLGRAPDPDGWGTFSSMVRRTPLADLVAAILCSDEFRKSPLHDAVARREGEDLTLVEIGDGLRLFVSPHDSGNASIYRAGSYEPHLAAALEAVVGIGMTVCVVGGNIGYHVVRLARSVGPSGRLLAFEARPENVALLRRNVVLNALHNVLVLSFAVTDGQAYYRYVPAQGTNGYIEPLGPLIDRVDELRDAALVQSISLDDFGSLLSTVDILLLDVEGAEGLVLRGAARLLADRRPVVFTELSCGQLERTSGIRAEAVLSPLEALGYVFDVVDFSGDLVPFGSDVTRLVGYARARSGSHVDVRCMPSRARATHGQL